MLTLNAMPHEPHGFSASMFATGREPALPPDLVSNTSPSLASENALGYVDTIQQGLQLTHQQMITPPAVPSSNPYHEGSLIYVLITPPECTSKLTPRWKGPFRICRIPNEYQVTYEDDGLERTVHINHAKPAKFTAPDLPEPVPPVEAPRPPLGYLPTGLARKSTKPHAPPVAPSEAPMAPPAAPEVPVDRSSPAAAANQHPEPTPPRRRSPRLRPEPGQAHAILGRPSAPQPQSQPRPHAANSSSHQHSPLDTEKLWDQRRTLSPSLASDWLISAVAKASTSAPSSNSPTLSTRQRIQPPALLWEATLPAQVSTAFATP